MNTDPTDIAIIGGGASGMMAALTAAQNGCSVHIFERMNRIGKKLLVTGNSRCNLTNLSVHPEKYHGSTQTFITEVLKQCDVRATLHIFQNLGLAWKADHENRVYPVSEQASSVLDLLRFALARFQVKVSCSARVTTIEKRNKDFQITLKNHQRYTAKRLILAAGGQAMKDLGSNGSGFILAESVGHQCIPPFPALVKLKLSNPYARGMKGVRTDACLRLLCEGQTGMTVTGEILFTEDGLSGIPALQISRSVHQAVEMHKTCQLQIDLLPAYTAEELKTDLGQRFRQLPHLNVEQSLLSILKKRLIIPVLKTSGIPHHLSTEEVTEAQISTLIQVIKCWTFSATGTKSWNEAQVTAGGVDTADIHPQTMESRIAQGLYFAGEIMDVDGDCGGYNLQWAWSTGILAGKAATQSLKKRKTRDSN